MLRPTITQDPRATLALALAVTALAAACGRAPGETAAAEPSARLADTGLYADFDAREVRSGNLPYSPQYPLWSDGASKRRWIHLPAGTAIDASDPDAWRFPVGTKLWKEFAFERRIETRYMELGANGRWTYATYAWSEDESDALLAPELGVARACESSPGVRYDLPARSDCLACHEGRPMPVLGFTALQLSPDRDPLAPHAETPEPGSVDLTALLERGLVRGLPAKLAEHPPRIVAASPRERAVLGYLSANCGMCHNTAGALAGLDFALDYPLDCGTTPPANATAVQRPSRFQLPDAGAPDCRRIVPGAPERSVLARRLGSRNPLLQMPPLGSRAVDTVALSLVEAWIREDLAPDA